MPTPQGIANPGGAYALPLAGTNVGGALVMSNDVACLELINNSGATRQYGDVVIVDVTGLLAATTTTANNQTVVGVVAQYQSNPVTAIPAGAPMLVQYRGVARVNIGANTVAALDVLSSFTTAGQAATNNALTAPTIAAMIGVALEASTAKDTNNTIRVRLCVGV